jgi:hypothetical protein
MPSTIDTTVAGASANSYCTVAFADSYHEDSLYGSAWVDVAEDQKVRALLTATRLLDEQYEFVGSATTSTQALKWPRFGVYDQGGNSFGVLGIHGYLVSSTEIPLRLQQATAELGKWLLASDRSAEPKDAEGVRRLVAGPVEVEFKDGNRGRPLIPEAVRAMLRVWITGGGQSIEVPLRRV